jgi:hypothetical protein
MKPSLHNLIPLLPSLVDHLRLPPLSVLLTTKLVKFKVRVTLRLAVYRQSVRLGVMLLETHKRNHIFPLYTCCYISYGKSCLTRGWVCRFKLLLFLASAVILRPESRGTHDHILRSQIRDSSKLEGQVRILIRCFKPTCL